MLYVAAKNLCLRLKRRLVSMHRRIFWRWRQQRKKECERLEATMATHKAKAKTEREALESRQEKTMQTKIGATDQTSN